ncbi:hypothetical protein [Streptomyces sp. NPDC004008]
MSGRGPRRPDLRGPNRTAASGPPVRLARVWADSGYTGRLSDWTTQHLGLGLVIVRRSGDVGGFRS